MFSFGFDTIELASSQEKYAEMYKNGQKITADQLSGLQNCLWVKLATSLSPANLVLRQWALIDLFTSQPDHRRQIFKMFDLLSYKQDDNGMRIWAEGHYYFWYTMVIIQLWIDKFTPIISMNEFKDLINKINKGFTATAYLRNGVLYGAPFGDIRDVPLAFPVQMDRKPKAKVSIVTMEEQGDKIQYNITGRPIGFNLHIPKNDSQITVVGGIPIGFKFYEGWDKKYKNKWEEITDMMDPKRVKSLICI